MTRRWGAAGVRLTDDEVRKRDAAAAARAVPRAARRRRDDEIAYELWRAGAVRPCWLTYALDQHDLYGPKVDRACGVEEPAVDLWEEGRRYPTWEQLVALARLCGVTPRMLTRLDEPLPWSATSMRFHAREPATPPVLAFDPAAVAAVVAGTPERLP